MPRDRRWEGRDDRDDLVALVIAVIGIVRGRRRGLSFIALGFALVPVALVALTAVAANATV